MAQRRRPTTTRRIFFYRTRVTESEDDEEGFDPVEAARLIRGLRFDDGSRYLEMGEGKIMCVWPRRSNELPVRMVLGLVRHSDLPQLEQGGDILPLDILAEQGLLEQTHMTFFRNGIVGSEFNYNGMRRPSRLAYYLEQKFPVEALPRVRFDTLLRPDVVEQLNRFEDVRLLHLSLNREDRALVRQAAPSVFDALDASFEAIEAPTIEIVLRNRPHSRDPLPASILGMVRSLAGNDGVLHSANKFKIKGLDGQTGDIEDLDLLRDLFVVTRRIVKQNEQTRALDSESMFREIDRAYAALRNDLEAAAGVV